MRQQRATVRSPTHLGSGEGDGHISAEKSAEHKYSYSDAKPLHLFFGGLCTFKSNGGCVLGVILGGRWSISGRSIGVLIHSSLGMLLKIVSSEVL